MDSYRLVLTHLPVGLFVLTHYMIHVQFLSQIEMFLFVLFILVINFKWVFLVVFRVGIEERTVFRRGRLRVLLLEGKVVV